MCYSFYETEENGSERLHSEARHKLLRLQAVSTVWLMSLCCCQWRTKHRKHKQKFQLFALPYQLIHIQMTGGWVTLCFVIRWSEFALCFFIFSPEVQSILNLSPPQEAELMNANPSPPVSIFASKSELCGSSFFIYTSIYADICKHVLFLWIIHTFWGSYYGSIASSSFSSSLTFSQPSPSQQINLGPSSNPSAKPSDFHFLKVIGKGSFGKVLLARHRTDDQFYAVKVLQKKAILKKKEVNSIAHRHSTSFANQTVKGVSSSHSVTHGFCFPQEKHIMSERNVLLKNVKHPFLVGLHYSFQTADKLYFVLDYINGGEVSCCAAARQEREYEAQMIEEKGEVLLFKEGAQWIRTEESLKMHIAKRRRELVEPICKFRSF